MRSVHNETLDEHASDLLLQPFVWGLGKEIEQCARKVMLMGRGGTSAQGGVSPDRQNGQKTGCSGGGQARSGTHAPCGCSGTAAGLRSH